ncbi:MAG TPA: hypothetical protein DCL61_29140 [Cyanobacteria bacterium UBA12227]|nr:hypothetical protein [Cyanobacteria bacterium UBA12227]HAX87322.1 hypothetical protein [Cyanobacteria bacterium UBA11370]HBY81717.1 hypothetical protein [Cyanobacteria bacterium UBA11148]
MPKFCLRLPSSATLALLIFTTGCSPLSPPDTAEDQTSSSLTMVSEQTPSTCPQIDPFTKAITKATGAANLAQSAQSPQDWDLVVLGWLQAIEAMQSIPPDSPKRVYAQKKVAEYFKNLDIAQQKAKTTSSSLPFASFNNPIFEEQLLLYLSYIAAVGTPDVLIVGSSRALVGIDPQQLQQSLAQQGKGNLKIFNFGVNGATAQLIDFQLRQLLTPDQLPRLIIWADGVRAFNSGRVDKTYNSLIASGGYQRLIAGDRPKLPERLPNTTDACENLPLSTVSPANQATSIVSREATSERWRLTRVAFETSSNPISTPTNRLLLTQLTGTETPQRLTLVSNPTGYSTLAIDANGFLSMDGKFDPKLYYQQNPRVVGRYDADYQPFSFSGKQAVALESIKAFTQQQKIPLVVVNLPVSRDYLDSVRLTRERQFRQLMQRQGASGGFIFIDLGEQWVNQNQYFADPSHLNRYGAAAVSNQLATNPQIPWPQ